MRATFGEAGGDLVRVRGGPVHKLLQPSTAERNRVYESVARLGSHLDRIATAAQEASSRSPEGCVVVNDKNVG